MSLKHFILGHYTLMIVYLIKFWMLNQFILLLERQTSIYLFDKFYKSKNSFNPCILRLVLV